MKVRELRQRLGKMDPELDVPCYTSDQPPVNATVGFMLLEIEEVAVTQGERMRLDDSRPCLKLGKGSNSVRLVTLEVTGDF